MMLGRDKTNLSSQSNDGNGSLIIRIPPIEDYLEKNDRLNSTMRTFGEIELEQWEDGVFEDDDTQLEVEMENFEGVEPGREIDSSHPKRRKRRKVDPGFIVDDSEEAPFRELILIPSDDSEDETENPLRTKSSSSSSFIPPSLSSSSRSSSLSLSSSTPVILSDPCFRSPPFPPPHSSSDISLPFQSSLLSPSMIDTPSLSLTPSSISPSSPTVSFTDTPPLRSPTPQSSFNVLFHSQSSQPSSSREVPTTVGKLKQMISLKTLETFMIAGLAGLLDGRLYDPTGTRKLEIISAATQWMQGIEPDDMKPSLKESSYEYWLQLLGRMDRWASLGEVVVRLLATSASEAECEREISRIKQQIGSHRWSLSSSALHALTQLIGPSVDEEKAVIR
jgi:hypothetical protein